MVLVLRKKQNKYHQYRHTVNIVKNIVIYFCHIVPALNQIVGQGQKSRIRLTEVWPNKAPGDTN